MKNSKKKLREALQSETKSDIQISESLYSNINTLLKYIEKKHQISLIGLYKAMKNEYSIDETNLSSKYQYVYPKITKKEMRYYSGVYGFEKHCFGMEEPREKGAAYIPDVVIAPGLCFSREGYRLGYGGGYFDRFFSKYDVCKIGVCSDKNYGYTFEYEAHDISFDYVVTELAIYDCVHRKTLKKIDSIL